MSSVVYIPVEGERILAQGHEYRITNYRLIQYDHGSRSSVSVPLHMIKEYKLTSRAAMFKIVNGIVNLSGAMPRREELRAAIGLREYDNLRVGGRRKIAEISGLPFIHPDHPYGRWSTIGTHGRFSRDFFLRFVWLKGEEVFTYGPGSFVLTNFRLYQFDLSKRKLYIFPLNIVHTFESRGNKLKMEASTGRFQIKGKVPRQDHLVRIWQARSWQTIPQEHLQWLTMEYSAVAMHHPLTQYTISDSSTVAPEQMAQESTSAAPAATGRSSGTVFVKPQIRGTCTNCGAKMSWEDIDWTGPDQYTCASCGQPHNVDYVRM